MFLISCNMQDPKLSGQELSLMPTICQLYATSKLLFPSKSILN